MSNRILILQTTCQEHHIFWVIKTNDSCHKKTLSLKHCVFRWKLPPVPGITLPHDVPSNSRVDSNTKVAGLRQLWAYNFLTDSPFSSIRWAVWIRRSQMASAIVASPITSCQLFTGSCDTKRDDLRPCQSSRISRSVSRLYASSGASPKSSRIIDGAGRHDCRKQDFAASCWFAQTKQNTRYCLAWKAESHPETVVGSWVRLRKI